jgi:hypothetical protein
MDKYHLTKDEGLWKLRREGAERSALTFDNKQDAVADSAEFMREHGGSLRVHKLNGEFQEERTYPRSADPRRSPG